MLVLGPEGRWLLMDETEGQGALAIELEVPDAAALTKGSRVVVWGAWRSRDVGQWSWRATRVATLPHKDSTLEFEPGLEIRKSKKPAEALGPELAEAGKWVVFVVRERPWKAGDGWAVSTPAEEEIVARVVLPGEHSVYGGQDMRARTERWRLARKQTYYGLVRRVFRPRISQTLPVIYLDSPPVRAR